ncbi:MAG TPA: DUF4388 domain-containing protein [Pyrinomonadaceae bacterium]|nr:DUF4388 domain-containing protein [Pyrinomonadaceae bacterium]
MEGQLSEHPLAELISEISEKKFSGALRTERERVKAVVYFEEGALVYATSNLRVHRLSERLRQQGLSSATVDESASDVAIAEALLSEGRVTRKQLDEILVEQVTNVMRLMLLWTDGTWSFDGRAHLSESMQVKVATPQLLLETARRVDLKFAASRFPGDNEAVFPAPDPSHSLNLLPTEAFLLSRVENSISVADLIALSGVPEPDAKQGIYGLILAGLLKRESWPYAFRNAPPQAARSEADKSRPNPAVKSSVQSAKQAAPPEPKPDPRRELDAFLERLGRASDHYEVLNISLSADLGEIKRMYHTIARNFHPDRFHDLAGTSTHIRLQSTFARITQAYETLTNPELRATYDGHIRALRRVRESQATAASNAGNASKGAEESENGSNVAQLAEQRFQEGSAALQQGQANAATSCFSAAARLVPHEPKYRAYLGRALAANPKTRRLAEVELQAAVKLAPANATYHVMLAVLYRDLGFALRAVSELDRALEIDPQNAEARRLLSALEAKK